MFGKLEVLQYIHRRFIPSYARSVLIIGKIALVLSIGPKLWILKKWWWTTPNIKLNPLEERNLNVWGRVTLTGCTKIPICGGLPTFTGLTSCSKENDNNNNSKQELANDVIIEETVHERLDEKILETSESEDEENGESILETEPINSVNIILLKRKKIRNQNLNTNTKRQKVGQSRQLGKNFKISIKNEMLWTTRKILKKKI
ncbi:hypothetical protein ABEB36_012740 [Hypothenemus hampei]|uniref:Uncharacterized protein n=1 Tax=Hypothenemus hampei TaxID=57062 RepID=A0ABD1ECY7_HYPHA